MRLHPFCSATPQRSLKCLVHGDDFVVSGEPTDLVWKRNEWGCKLEIDTTILGDGPGMSKEVASNLTSLQVPMSKESKGGGVRDKTDDIGETRKL